MLQLLVVMRVPSQVPNLVGRRRPSGNAGSRTGRARVQMSVWTYLYADDASQIAARELPRWQAWLDARSVDT